jgi:glycosyltransferase involved in cell wall biosynthesis
MHGPRLNRGAGAGGILTPHSGGVKLRQCYNRPVPPLHIAITCTQHPPGDNRVYMRLVCGFAQLGWRVSLIAPQRGPLPEMPAGAAYYPVAHVTGYLRRWREAGRVLPILRELRPDVVVFPDPELLAPIARFRRETGAVAVFDRHENFEQAGAYHAAGLADKLLGQAYAVFERYAVKRISGVIVVFDEMRQAIPNGVPTCVAHNYPTRTALEVLAAEPAAGTPEYTSVFIGAFRGVHGTQRLLEVVQELVNVRGRKEFTLYVAGQFDPGLADAAAQYIAEHRLGGNITLNPLRVPYDRVVALVAASKIGLCPLSRQVAMQNYLQNKLLEFMAAGLPVIASDTGPGGRILEASGCGRLLWAEDVALIADTVEEWLREPDAARAMGKRGQAYVLEHLVWETELAQLAQWLQDLRAKR